MTSVCFTGKGYTDTNSTQPQLRTRDVWSNMARSMGWTTVSKVNAFTSFLVASTRSTLKAREARNLGVTVITYDEFQLRYDNAVRLAAGGSRGVSTTGVDLDDSEDNGSIDYDPLARQKAAYVAAQREADLEERKERAAAKRQREEAEAQRQADDEALPGWGQF